LYEILQNTWQEHIDGQETVHCLQPG